MGGGGSSIGLWIASEIDENQTQVIEAHNLSETQAIESQAQSDSLSQNWGSNKVQPILDNQPLVTIYFRTVASRKKILVKTQTGKSETNEIYITAAHKSNRPCE